MPIYEYHCVNCEGWDDTALCARCNGSMIRLTEFVYLPNSKIVSTKPSEEFIGQDLHGWESCHEITGSEMERNGYMAA